MDQITPGLTVLPDYIWIGEGRLQRVVDPPRISNPFSTGQLSLLSRESFVSGAWVSAHRRGSPEEEDKGWTLKLDLRPAAGALAFPLVALNTCSG